ncbi:MAG: ABC-ATPase domain-containing protein [Oscillospiraceae bacterium]|nr:ABC-ATPase domain-containing protein [Oscillospiraceae bacterium]
MKRLNHYLLNMENNEKTYAAMYEGNCTFIMPTSGDPDSSEDSDATYWYDDEIAFTIERTHKLALDRPTVTIAIPVERLGLADTEFTPSPAAADYCLRAFKPYIDDLNEPLYNRARPDSENGKYYVYAPDGEVLVRNSALFTVCASKGYENLGGSRLILRPDAEFSPPKLCLVLRIQVQLPTRKIKRTRTMLCRDLPHAVDNYANMFDITELARAIELERTQNAIREHLRGGEYCAFVANGSILPRSKGTDLPMEGAKPFVSPPRDEIELCGVRGMGIRRGVTVITGGGYSGKSTLIDAISAGIYNHIAGDGRELCVTDDSAVTISAEDGRSVKNVNVSPFIKWIPDGDTARFSTEHASGSTSQAANIIEAIDCGARLLLIDEDRAATNFMIRDAMMKELIEREPITPFTDRVRELHERADVSTILVIGGSGEYLGVADRVFLMDEFVIRDATDAARRIYEKRGTVGDSPAPAEWQNRRTLLSDGFSPFPTGQGTERLEVSELGFILIGDERVDIRSLHNVATAAQLDALGFMLRRLMHMGVDDWRDLVTMRSWTPTSRREIDLSLAVDALYREIARDGLDAVHTQFFTTCQRFLDLPRKIEVIAAVNRMRRVAFSEVDGAFDKFDLC